MNEAEWRLHNSNLGNTEIEHITCKSYVWNSSDLHYNGLWRCNICWKKAPKWIIMQWEMIDIK